MGDKKTNKKKIYVSAFIAVILGGMNAAQASAWGPERETWTMDNPADYATINSITDNTSVGDERDFVRVAEAVTEGTSKAVDELHIKGGKDYVFKDPELWHMENPGHLKKLSVLFSHYFSASLPHTKGSKRKPQR